MAIATATTIDLYAGGKLLFADVSFKFEPRERMTLSGRNGAGKSTLLRVLAGERPPTRAISPLQKGARVALHDQRPPRDAEVSLGRLRLLRPRRDGGDRRPARGEVWRWRARGGDDAGLLGGRSSGSKLAAATAGATTSSPCSAVSALARRRPLAALHPRRARLTRASAGPPLATCPDLLLLDERKNHLDIPSLEWLERYPVDLDAAVVLVSTTAGS